ncbi:DUF4856 domain-containing protein [Cytophaga sp. FL35]|uniref:DUF4856 domain-containing protein n=1 Tax=Cytophaga sp. FL35 TaxID=1904456 RepID=UPI0016534DA4|nr:DUF4856 domain-containing protein [Cytophaga sp. FL35]MBC6998330.1 DUF4856 domain-containing protein [Cytophaga sp. FL35]
MKKVFLSILAFSTLLLTSCSSDDEGNNIDPIAATCDDGIMNGDETGVDCGGANCTPCETAVEAPESYSFERDGASTVNFSGQTTRLLMGNEILAALSDETSTDTKIQAMFAHAEGEMDFEDADLNASDKNILSKTAASKDYFSDNTADQSLIRKDFTDWISAQVSEVFPNWNTAAAPGTAGQIADGESTRYVNAQGLEYNQVFNKGLIGALTVDQAINNYLSPEVLDEGQNRANNDAGTVEEGKSYTTMEHKWDEAYGYVYGQNADATDPNADLGADNFLNKYIGRVEGDDNFAGIADEIFQAFKLGRAAIVAQDYEVRDAQAEIIRQKISEVIGIRAVYYLQQGKNALAQETPNYGTAFHDLSEGYGFIYSLQFTRKPGTTEPYFSKAEVDAFLMDILDDGDNGLWDVAPATLETIAIAISERFDFSMEEASE